MKTVESTWRNLAAGHQKVRQLEVELRTQWQPRVEEAHQRKVQTELAEWESRRRQRAQGHQHALSTWTQTVAEEQELLRTNVGSDVRRARLVVPASIVVFIVAALLDGGIDQLTVIILLGICIGAGIAFAPTIRQTIQIARLKSRKPPAPSDDAKPPQDPVMRLSLTDRWWHEISDDGRLASAASEYGNEGEERFFRYLTDVLPDDHFGARSVMVKRRLDVDVLVVGPTAVWVFEVKHWSGTITCHRGSWRRIKIYHGPGGVPMRKEEEIKSFDQQWVRERTEVAETLRRRLPPSSSTLEVRGGLVFTHPDINFDIDGSIQCEYGSVEYWADRLNNASEGRPEIISQQFRLKIVDALPNRADSVTDGFPERRCCIDLAERIFVEMIDSAKKYIAHHGDR